ncbi:fimbrial biogenesis chaperone [Enterobacter quasiroggenkampii]|uniref:fimbrial biogenesis chaperone n=1 Tax=Enterobacter quasiroggenkampii TaxID=2497436 RepID=UPI0021CF6B12|nr:molecular chaperone [Enterobacter quasiroggenkampii]MCU6346175.1 molecular chaperone [Enterobacter quasiroggenkampii]
MKKLTLSLLLAAVAFSSLEALAGVQIGGTRIIYNEKEKEASIQLRNPDDKAFLVQSWTETETGTPDKTFAVTPPLFRLDAHQNNSLRILFRGSPLQSDRETLFWLNVKAIPSTTPSDGENQLQLAVKTRIKLIYRPDSLKKNSPEDFASRLKWQKTGNSLTVNNDSAFYMNFASVALNGVQLNNVTYVAPKSSKTFPLGSVPTGGKIEWKVFNDFGVPGQVFSASY